MCSSDLPGAVAEYHVLPAENCVPIPDDVSLDAAVLVEPLSIGLYAVRVSPLGDCLSFRGGAKGTGPCFRPHVLAAMGCLSAEKWTSPRTLQFSYPIATSASLRSRSGIE